MKNLKKEKERKRMEWNQWIGDHGDIEKEKMIDEKENVVIHLYHYYYYLNCYYDYYDHLDSMHGEVR